MARLLGQLRVEDHLDEHVPQLLAHVRQVEAVDRVEEFAALVDQAAGEALVGLLLVPRAAPRAAQPGDGRGAVRRWRSLRERMGPF